jgi:hypothetical protein
MKARLTNSASWEALLKIKEVYFTGIKLTVSKGDLVRFWIDL